MLFWIPEVSFWVIDRFWPCSPMSGTCERCAFPLRKEDLVYFLPGGETSIMFAACKGYVQCVKDLIKAGVDVNQAGKYKETAVMCAAAGGHSSCVQMLIEAGADVNQTADDNATALMWAALKGYSSCVRILIKAGADVNQPREDGTALLLAAWRGHSSCIQLLIEAGADVNQSVKKNRTATMVAAFEGHSSCVQLLIEAGADVNISDTMTNNALIYAAIGSQFCQTQWRVQGGTPGTRTTPLGPSSFIFMQFSGKIWQNDRFSPPPLGLAPPCLGNSGSATETYDARANAGHSGCDVNNNRTDSKQPKRDHVACVQLLANAGTDVTMAASIMKSTECGNYKFLEILLKTGADVNFVIEDDCALIQAVANCKNDLEVEFKKWGEFYMKENHDPNKCLEMLLQAGADVNITNNSGNTALAYAAALGYVKYLKMLLEAGADVNQCNIHGATALVQAVGRGHSECVKILLKSGTEDKSVALFHAVSNGEYECMNLLITAGADVNIRNQRGDTILHYCRYKNNTRILKRLLEAGAYVNRKNNDRQNALTQLICLGGPKHLDLAFLLLVAGETFPKTRASGTTCSGLLEELILQERKLDLKHLCREKIRTHFLKLNPHDNLFHQTVRLKGILPSLLVRYLVHDISLE